MSILLNADFEYKLRFAIENSVFSVVILSAFLKVAALDWLAAHANSKLKVTIVARWQLSDLISGASDIFAYEVARDNGWRFYINQNMHYKMYLVDQETLFVGSANFTQNGMHIGLSGNDEASVQLAPTDIDLLKLDQYVANCCLMSDALFFEIKDFVEQNRAIDTLTEKITWPNHLKEMMLPSSKHLWVNDLLFNTPSSLHGNRSNFVEHDLVLLGISSFSFLENKEIVLQGFKSSTVWRWLLRIVESSENEFVRFGEITAKLHNALVDDPKPYRSDVKVFLANLYEWIRYLDPPEIGIKKFNRTEALFFK